MTLRPVGRKIVNILVNGTQQDSFTQNQESLDYDVSVSSSSQANVTDHTVSKSTTLYDTFSTKKPLYWQLPDGMTIDFVWDVSQSGFDTATRILHDGNENDTSHYEGTATNSLGIQLYYPGAGSDTVSWSLQLSYNIDTTSSITVGSVTQN
jgi:hypothetical protein